MVAVGVSFTINCNELEGYIPPLTIALSDAEVKIESSGFMMNGPRGCMLLLERIPSSDKKEFRFGLAFLQNFVT